MKRTVFILHLLLNSAWDAFLLKVSALYSTEKFMIVQKSSYNYTYLCPEWMAIVKQSNSFQHQDAKLICLEN